MDLDDDTSTMLRCANCGAAEGDDIKLKTCTACKSVRYCGVKCQKKHRPKHKKACKERAAELRDEILFRQPESTHLGDCPICCLPLPLDLDKLVYMQCCSQTVCQGCNHANQLREMRGRLENKCAFCRAPLAKSEKEAERKNMDRVEANDPVAMYQLAFFLMKKGEYMRAFEYCSKAASLGDTKAHATLGRCHREGLGVEKDEKKATYHLEQASIGGHPQGRHNLGVIEWEIGKKERAVKHWIIAAKQGEESSLDELKHVYTDQKGLISKEDFASALRGYQAAVDATKSEQREVAYHAVKRLRYDAAEKK